MGYDVPGVDAFLELAREVDLDGFWDADPELAARPDSSHLRTTNTSSESAYRSSLTGVRISAKQHHAGHNMVFEEMLVGYATLDQPDALLLDELSNQNMEISDLLVRSRKTMIYNKMDPFWVPDLLDAHLTEDLDRQRSCAILCHCQVGR